MIVLGCRDVGPAKYMAILADNPAFKDAYWIGSDLSLPIFKKNNLLQTNKIEIPDGAKLVVTGTILGDGLDKQLLSLAKCKNVRTVSIVEHWGWYRRRFQVNGGALILPDHIFVNDQIAFDQAIEEGIPKERLVIVGNPVLEFSGNEVLDLLQDPSKILAKYSLPNNKRRVLFISEDLKTDFFDQGELRYSEFDCFKVINKILGEHDQLIVKRHPSECVDKYREISTNYIEINEISIQELVLISDVIIGMSSMLLLELAAYRSDIISFRPGERGRKFIGESLGVVDTAHSEGELVEKISSSKISFKKNNLQQLFSGSKSRVISKLLKYSS